MGERKGRERRGGEGVVTARREERRRRGERKEWEKGDERGVEEGEEQCLWMHTLISTKKTFQINPGSQKVSGGHSFPSTQNI